MRSNRITGGPWATYHCMTRTVNGAALFGDLDKEVLRKMLRRVADFSGVEVLTYALMNNHFHVLVRVPEKGRIDDTELMRRYRALYTKPSRYETASADVLESRLQAGGGEAEKLRTRLLARMGDVSEFMKTLKQRFTIYYNKTHGRYGTLWAERFKSVLVEGRGNPLQTMAAYIDLNPVRAGLVRDPKDYRFCGYAEAVAGNARAREGLRIVWGAYADGSRRTSRIRPGEALRAHRAYLFAKGAERASGADREAMLKVADQEDGVLPVAAALRCRVRYFSDGAVLGSAAFVKKALAAKSRSGPPNKKTKIQTLKGADWHGIAAPKGFRGPVFL